MTVRGHRIQSRDSDVLRTCSNELNEVVYWVNRAIISSVKYRGTCTRKVKLTKKNELEYYKPGKVFRFQNILSAWIPKETNDRDAARYSTRNVTFYIYSVNGV